jgi:Ca2+/H+ antiporter
MPGLRQMSTATPASLTDSVDKPAPGGPSVQLGLSILLVFVPVSIVAAVLAWNPVAVFVLSFVALIPLAALLSEATEELAADADSAGASSAALSMTLAVIGLMVPTFFAVGVVLQGVVGQSTAGNATAAESLDTLTYAVAGVLFVLYVLLRIYQFRRGEPDAADEAAKQNVGDSGAPARGRRRVIVQLAACILASAVVSEILSGAVEPWSRLARHGASVRCSWA